MKHNENLSRRMFLGKLNAGTVGLAASGLTVSGKSRDGFSALSNNDFDPWSQTSEKKIRIGIVGGGFGTDFFWHQHPNCIVEAVSDLQEERKKTLMEVYQCSKSYHSLEELVKDDKLDAVAVFTDAPSHGRHIIEVLKHGKHCITAVPLSMTLEDLYLVKEWKEKTGLKVMMAETSMYRSDLYNAKIIYEKGMFGKIVYSEGELGRFDKNILHIGEGIKATYEGIGDRNEIGYPDNRPTLPEGMGQGGHGGSHGHLTNEFIMALVEDREPLIDLYEGIAMTAPGIDPLLSISLPG